jgi:hypothetical protein
MLTLADGTFFPLVADASSRGRARGPAGLAPEASARVFSRDPPVCGVLFSTGFGNVPAGLGGAMRT